MSVPVGAEFDVRLQTPLTQARRNRSSASKATTILDYTMNGATVIPAGSVMRGFVSSVRAAGKIDRKGSITLSFDEIKMGDRTYKLRASVEQALDGKMAQDTDADRRGAVVGAILGGLIGGGKGALAGVIIGGGGTMAGTEGADVDLPVGGDLRIRLDRPLRCRDREIGRASNDGGGPLNGRLYRGRDQQIGGRGRRPEAERKTPAPVSAYP